MPALAAWDECYALCDQAFVRSVDGRHCCIFNQHSSAIGWWDSCLVLGVIYSTAYTPLAVVFTQTRWEYHGAIGALLDAAFVLDMIIRFRTSYRDHGYDVTNRRTIAANYLRGCAHCHIARSLHKKAVPKRLAVLTLTLMHVCLQGLPSICCRRCPLTISWPRSWRLAR